jgi:hypothetical protein
MRESDIFEKRVYSESGVCIATLTLRLPSEPAGTRLYKRLAERYIKQFERRTVPLMKKEFLSSTDEKKRFTFKPIVFTLEYARTESANLITVDIEEKLTRRGKLICRVVRHDTFDKSSGLMLPQRSIKRKKHS